MKTQQTKETNSSQKKHGEQTQSPAQSKTSNAEALKKENASKEKVPKDYR